MIDPLSSLPAGAAGSATGPDLAQMRARADAATGAGEPSDFASVLAQLVKDTARTLRTAEATSEAGVLGQASVQQVVEAIMSAEQNLQTVIAVRDKAVGAYLEISRMAI
jgi:flagellar hook-basal body complex protein FliE